VRSNITHCLSQASVNWRVLTGRASGINSSDDGCGSCGNPNELASGVSLVRIPVFAPTVVIVIIAYSTGTVASPQNDP